MSVSVLIADDDAMIRKNLSQYLGAQGFSTTACGSKAEALAILEKLPYDVVLLDLRLPDSVDLDCLSAIKERWPRSIIIMMTAFATVETAIEAVRKGAFDFLTKPFSKLDIITLAIRRALNHSEVVEKLHQVQTHLKSQFSFDNLVGHSASMQEVVKMIKDVAYSDATVLISGESGTGKELIASALHMHSPRKDRPFVTCNCGAIVESLLESELFGHTKGAFTGAVSDKKGIFEVANTGTLFLDEIGDMPQATQVKLLRALQEGEIKRVGDSKSLRVDVRVVAATNKDLEALVKRGGFRQDLFYRINVIHVHLPPLRARLDDIEPLTTHFIGKYATRLKKKVSHYSPDFLQALLKHKWPGNVRELENVIERAVVIAKQPQLGVADLPLSLLHQGNGGAVTTDDGNLLSMSYQQAKKICLEGFNDRYLNGLLQSAGGNITKAAAMAGMFRSNFKSLMRKANIAATRFKTSTDKTPDNSPPENDNSMEQERT